MGRNQTPRHGFARIQEMANVRPAVPPRARGTVTARIDRGIVLGKLRIFQIHSARTREGLGISSVSGRQNAVKHIDPAADSMDDVLLIPHPHQVARLLRRQTRGRKSHNLRNLLGTLPDRNTPNRKAGQIMLADRLH